MGLEMPTMKNSNEVKIGCCIYAILLLSATLSAGAPFGPDSTYTWGIGNDQLDIAPGSVITSANLTIHNPVFRLPPIEGAVYVHLLDNPDAEITEYVDDQPEDYFDGYGVFLTRISPFSLSSSPSDITIELDKLRVLSTIISPMSFITDPSALVGPIPITYSSAMPELLDYAGTGRSFGFGLDCDGFTFDALTLELIVQSMTSPIPENRLIFSIQNPNRPPVATWDSYTFKQDDPAQTLFVLSNDSDPDGDPLSISAVRPPLHGQAEIIENNTAIRYTPAAGYTGRLLLVYTVSYGNNGTATTVIIITVQAACTLSTTAKNGTITKSPSKTTYAYGETVTLTAKADPGYLFTGWSGDVSGMVNPVSLTLTTDMSVGANFWPILW